MRDQSAGCRARRGCLDGGIGRRAHARAPVGSSRQPVVRSRDIAVLNVMR